MSYHMNKHGVRAVCEAPEGECPLGGDHYETIEEADAGIAARHEAKHPSFQGLQSKASRKAGVRNSLPTGELAPAKLDDEGNELRPAQDYDAYYKGVEKKHFGSSEDVSTPEKNREFLKKPGSQFDPKDAESLNELVQKTAQSRREGLAGDDREELIKRGADPAAFSPNSTYLITPVGGRLGSVTSDSFNDSTPLGVYEKTPGSNIVSLTVEQEEKPHVSYGVLVMGDQSKISPGNPGEGDPIVMTAHPGLPSKTNPERAQLSRDERAEYDAREHEAYKELQSEGRLTVGEVRKLKGRDFNLNVVLKD